MYRNLDAQKIIETLARLRQRIRERFPNSGLGKVCDELQTIAVESHARSEWISRPIIGLRIAAVVLILLILGGLVLTIVSLAQSGVSLQLTEFIQVLEAGLNDIVLIGAALVFLVTVENRIKRSRALKAIHELRSMAHVIDMHQLTKDPERTIMPRIATPSSPKQDITPVQLSRYLDYCSEMLSLTGKVAALHAQYLNDGVVLAAVNEVEDLTTGLSRKIWQKIMVLHTMRGQEEDAPPKLIL